MIDLRKPQKDSRTSAQKELELNEVISEYNNNDLDECNDPKPYTPTYDCWGITKTYISRFFLDCENCNDDFNPYVPPEMQTDVCVEKVNHESQKNNFDKFFSEKHKCHICGTDLRLNDVKLTYYAHRL